MSNLKSQVEAALGNFWDKNAIQAVGHASTVDDSLVPLDSISACEALLDIEEIVKKEIPVEQVVKKGGYESREVFVSEVTEAVMQLVGAQP